MKQGCSLEIAVEYQYKIMNYIVNNSFSVGFSCIYFIVAAAIKCYNLRTILTEHAVYVENTSN